MQTITVSVFHKTPEYPMLRVTGNDGTHLGQRALDRQEVDRFIDRVEEQYGTRSPDLLDLGESLYAWLDGPTERWLEPLVSAVGGLALHIDCDERFRHLPWELIASDRRHLGVDALRPLTPVYQVAQRSNAGPVANRPLRVLFMATSPEDVKPVLDFEHEEATILSATGDYGVELVVEESGSLSGLQYVFESFGAGYFDVLHLSGHADITEGTPRFVMENDIGFREDATAEDIAVAVQGLWPGLVFLSGCLTGQASEEGALPSMAEALVAVGARAVLGWALPVGDMAATTLASTLYAALSKGVRIDEATARARYDLFEIPSPYWHLLRLYADATPLTELVTRPQTPGRELILVRPVNDVFLDPTGLSRVAPRERFVGRRRQIQRCLRGLRHSGAGDPFEVLVLHGMGGLGKSTLASRLLERTINTHKPAVWFGRLDEIEIRKFTSLVMLDDIETQKTVNKILDTPDESLADRLRFILKGPLGSVPCLFVFDDFESGNLEQRNGTHVCTPEALEIVTAFATAIRATGSPSRVIITSRYTFPLPDAVQVTYEAMESLHGPELDKKLRLTTNLRPESPGDSALRELAIETAAGNPRMIEWLDLVLSDTETDHQTLLEAIAAKAELFRENVLAEELLAAQSTELGRVLALAGVYELPVPLEAVQALNGDIPIEHHLERAASIGLIEAGTDPATGNPRYLVSSILKPLLASYISDDEQTKAYGEGARILHQLWVSEDRGGE